jgi:hypothetical protein
MSLLQLLLYIFFYNLIDKYQSINSKIIKQKSDLSISLVNYKPVNHTVLLIILLIKNSHISL